MSRYQYRAFISYSHADERWARWLHRRLESYRVPKALARKAGLSTRALKPVFRDRDELASSADLGTGILEALDASEALIVICSESAARSRWVCGEIEHFLERHGPDRVFCLIVDPFGEFPPPLAGREPLAADTRSTGDGRERARLKIIAGLLGVGFDDIVQRDRQQRRITIAYRTGALTIGMALAASLSLWLGRPDPCPDPLPRLVGVWDDTVRETISSSFTATGLPFARESASRVLSALDGYASDWRAMHVASCQATRVTGAQSEALLDKRMNCLDERLFDLKALAGQLAAANEQIVEQATDATSALRSMRDCADTAVLAASYPPPAPDQAERILGLTERLANSRAALELGQLPKASSTLRPLLPEILRADYPPLSAAGLHLLGKIQAEFADSQLVDAFERGLEASARAGNDTVSADMWISYLHALTESLGDLDAAKKLLVAARAATARLNPHHPLTARLRTLEGTVAFREGRLNDARNAMSQALELSGNTPGPARANLKSNLAVILSESNDLDAARQLALEAHADLVFVHGPDHPATAEPLVTLAGIEEASGNLESALGYMTNALELRKNAFGTEGESVAITLRGAGWLLKELGNFQEAEQYLSQALTLYRGLDKPAAYQIANLLNAIGDLKTYRGDLAAAEQTLRQAITAWSDYPDNPNVAIPLTNLGALRNRLGDAEDALQLCRQALALDETSLGPAHPDVAFSLTCTGEALTNVGRATDALELLQRAVDLRQDGKPWELAWSEFNLGRALMQTGAIDTGQSWIARSHGRIREEPGPDPWLSQAIEDFVRQELDATDRKP